MIARRTYKRRDWPRGLYEPRPGYYVWRHPVTKETHAIGHVPLPTAKQEAIAANVFAESEKASLVDKLKGADKTVADLLEKMPHAENRNTAKAQRSLDKKIKTALGKRPVLRVAVSDVAAIIEAEASAGRARSAQALRSRCIEVFREAQALGWSAHNPASPTKAVRVGVARGRLTLDSFKAIFDAAPRVSEWLQQAMKLALLTGADRSTIAGLQKSNIVGDDLVFKRPKTRGIRPQPIAIPLRIGLDCMSWTLKDALAHKTGVLSPYLVHHVRPHNNAPAGSSIHPDRISHAFMGARKLAKIPDEGAPTFHEIRSLSKRLYDQQGNVDTKALLDHADDKTARKYADPRGVEPIRVSVK